MSFLLDPFILMGIGMAGAMVKKKWFHTSTWFMHFYGAAMLALFYGISVGLFVNAPYANFIIQPLLDMGLTTSGLDWMVNSGVFHFNVQWPWSPTVVFIGILAFCTYPLWLYIGIINGYMLFGRHPKQTGLIGLFKGTQ